MFFRQRTNADASISYFLGCAGLGKGIAVDVLGDTLFVGSVGRPDLAGQEKDMAGQLWNSLHERLLNLPGEVEVFPGHQAGSACGADISGKPSSTIGFEKRWNPLLALGKEAFTAMLTSTILPRPSGMERIVAANLGQRACA